MGKILFSVLLLNVSILTGQETKPASGNGIIHSQAFDAVLSTADTGLVHQKLDISLVGDVFNHATGDSSISYSVHQRMTCLYTRPFPASVIEDAYSTLVIDSVRACGNLKTVIRTDQDITIPLAENDFTSDTCFIDLWYRYRGTGQQGFFYYAQSPQTGTLAPLAYTFAEPTDSPFWFVTKNDTRIKPTLEMNITVPSGYRAGSNGILTGTTMNADGSVTFHWREDYPIAMYLTSFAVSQYATYSDYYHRVTNPADSVEIKYYFWPADENQPLSSTITYNARRCFSNVVNMMQYYSTIFSEFPFDKYGMAAVYPFGPGGMEHQTLTTIHRNWIRIQDTVAPYGFSEGGIAHEMVHQWFGDMITCETWADIWLNESFATYGEKLWQEHFYGEQHFKDLMRGTMNFTSASWAGPVYVNPPPPYLFGNVVYDKGSWVLHMLRYVMGDSAFFTLLKTYAHDSALRYRTATTERFTSLATQVAGRDLSTFFDQWLMKIGWPVYQYSSTERSTAEGSIVTLSLSQVQDDPSKAGSIPSDGTIFVMPVQFRFIMGPRDTLITVTDSLRDQTFQFVFNSPVDSIVCDPDNRILKQFYNTNSIPGPASTPPTARHPAAFYLYQNYPNPFMTQGVAAAGGTPVTTVAFDVPAQAHVTLTITNILGQTVRRLTDSVMEPGPQTASWDGRNDGNIPMPSGVYFITMRAGSYRATQKLLLVR